MLILDEKMVACQPRLMTWRFVSPKNDGQQGVALLGVRDRWAWGGRWMGGGGRGGGSVCAGLWCVGAPRCVMHRYNVIGFR